MTDTKVTNRHTDSYGFTMTYSTHKAGKVTYCSDPHQKLKLTEYDEVCIHKITLLLLSAFVQPILFTRVLVGAKQLTRELFRHHRHD